MAKPEVRLSS